MKIRLNFSAGGSIEFQRTIDIDFIPRTFDRIVLSPFINSEEFKEMEEEIGFYLYEYGIISEMIIEPVSDGYGYFIKVFIYEKSKYLRVLERLDDED
jgi:hypothetical protein